MSSNDLQKSESCGEGWQLIKVRELVWKPPPSPDYSLTTNHFRSGLFSIIKVTIPHWLDHLSIIYSAVEIFIKCPLTCCMLLSDSNQTCNSQTQPNGYMIRSLIAWLILVLLHILWFVWLSKLLAKKNCCVHWLSVW